MSILARSCKTHCMPSDISTGLLERLCIRCGERIEPKRPKNTSFHNQACKQAWYRARQAARASENLAYAEQQFRHCRKRAHFYRLAILIENAVWMYPPIARPSVRFDGLSRTTPGFLVDPFEPPAVPIKGRYSVFLFDGGGQPVRNIEGCQFVRADPLWQLSVESGDRSSDL